MFYADWLRHSKALLPNTPAKAFSCFDSPVRQGVILRAGYSIHEDKYSVDDGGGCDRFGAKEGALACNMTLSKMAA